MGFEPTSVGYKQHMYNTTLLCLPAVQDGYLPPSQTTPLLCSGASFPSAVRREEANVHIVGKWCIGCHDSSVDTHIHKHIVQTLCPHPLFPLLSLSSLPFPPLFPSTVPCEVSQCTVPGRYHSAALPPAPPGRVLVPSA